VRTPVASFFWSRTFYPFFPSAVHVAVISHHSHSLGLQMLTRSVKLYRSRVGEGGGRSKRGDETVTAELELEGSLD